VPVQTAAVGPAAESGTVAGLDPVIVWRQAVALGTAAEPGAGSATAFGLVAALAVEPESVAAPRVGLLMGPVEAATEVLEFLQTTL